MIQAIIFDLDGTLVQTEILKALSYARAVRDLSYDTIDADEVVEAFKDVVGLSREEVASQLLERFQLEEAAERRMAELDASSSLEAFIHIRMQFYKEILEDSEILHDHACPYNIGLLKTMRSKGYRTGLATMSRRKQAEYVLHVLGLAGLFDVIVARDEVRNAKPDPEIYIKAAGLLQVERQECMVVEDSVSGIKAALAAGMSCLAVTNLYTRKKVHTSGLLPDKWIVDDLQSLKKIADQMITDCQNS